MNRPTTRRWPWPLSWSPPQPLRWVLLLGWMGLIFVFSADSESGATSGGILEALVGLLTGVLGPIGPETRETLHLLLRKAAHFTEYAVLALLWAGVLPRGPRRLLMAFCLTTAYAVTDEVHQAFVPNRGPSPVDVLIDASGAAVALAGLWLASLWLAGRRLREERHLDPVTKIH